MSPEVKPAGASGVSKVILAGALDPVQRKTIALAHRVVHQLQKAVEPERTPDWVRRHIPVAG